MAGPLAPLMRIAVRSSPRQQQGGGGGASFIQRNTHHHHNSNEHHHYYPQESRPGADLATSGWAIDTWSNIFSRWLPSTTHAVSVRVNGGKATTNSAVVHAALSIAFGALNIEIAKTALANLGLKVKNNPVENVCTVSFALTSASGIFVANFLSRLVFKIGEAIGRGIKQYVDEMIPDAPGVAIREGRDRAPGNVGNRGQNMDAVMADVDIQMAKLLGASAFDMGLEEIRGGAAPLMINTRQRLKPFDDMRNKVLLTRQPAANPAPPAVDGVDLRTLVAQVLHDPGVRPPLPKTSKGPPVVRDELRKI